jgi:triacylglycerol lipase
VLVEPEAAPAKEAAAPPLCRYNRPMQLVAWIAGALSVFDTRPAAPDPQLRPVILVHGIHSDANCMRRLERYLRAQGRPVYAPTLSPCTGCLPLEDLAQQLAAYVDAQLAGRKFDLVAFSMGGLISRYYVQRLGGAKRVEHFVTMATPHNGTRLAWLHPGVGVRQMRPGSDFLRDLQTDANVLRDVKFTSFYTPLDTVVVPAKSSAMPQARNIAMWATIHPSFLLEKRCLKAVGNVLAEQRDYAGRCEESRHAARAL